MDSHQRREEYLKRAEEAEQLAAKATDLHTKTQWEKIASGYRNLADNPVKGP